MENIAGYEQRKTYEDECELELNNSLHSVLY